MEPSSPSRAIADGRGEPETALTTAAEFFEASKRKFSGGPRAGQLALAIFLFLLTFFTATTLGAVWWTYAQTGLSTTLALWLSPRTVTTVWSSPTYLASGVAFSIPLLFILLSHELGHYLVCRRYGLRSNPPYFLPAPIALGTLGAFIKIRSPIRNKRQLFDVGVSGPIAGFVALIPFLLYGISISEVSTIILADPPIANAQLYRPGQSLLMYAVTYAFHGELGPAEVLDLHPFALAAWVGLLATSLNLLPLGQLDGGHILYALLGKLQRRVAIPLWVALGLIGTLWPGWFLWCAVIFILGLRHPPVIDESIELGSGRRTIGLLGLLLLLLTFMPVPISAIWVVS